MWCTSPSIYEGLATTTMWPYMKYIAFGKRRWEVVPISSLMIRGRTLKSAMAPYFWQYKSSSSSLSAFFFPWLPSCLTRYILMLPLPKKNSYHARPQKACMIRPKTKYLFGYHPIFFFKKNGSGQGQTRKRRGFCFGNFVFSSPPRPPRSHRPTYI